MIASDGAFAIRVLRSGDPVDPDLRGGLVRCWHATANAGGAVGFPFPPVGTEEVAAAVDDVLSRVADERNVLFVAQDGAQVVGWVVLATNASPLVAHWGTVRRLQSHPAARWRGIGTALMAALTRVARDDLGLEQLHLAVRSGMGLEAFYERLGWRVVGRWPDSLRFADDDYRDEILMTLRLSGTSSPR